MSFDNLYSVTRNAVSDGYVSRIEAMEIEKHALKDDNTVTPAEKTFLRDQLSRGVYIEPRAQIKLDRLVTYGDSTASQEINELKSLHLWKDEYKQRASEILIKSTDTLRNRMGELSNLKREVVLWNDEHKHIGKEILINSNDPIVERMSSLRSFKFDANLWNDEYKETGKEMLLNSFDNKYARLRALDDFKFDAFLSNSEYEEIKDAILHDS
ncbi:MAG: hypothetical protein U0457_08630 [Candidatus Sericytochromatia bacterium]